MDCVSHSFLFRATLCNKVEEQHINIKDRINMKHSGLTYTALATALLLAPSTAIADDVVFSYDTGNGNNVEIGTSKKETYNVAMLVSGSDLNGKTLKAITVPFKSRENLSNLKIWMSKTLEITKNESGKKVFTPDVMSADMDFSSDTITYTLPEAYALTGDSIYVGYTFTVDDVKDCPTAKTPVSLTTESYQGGYYIYTSSTYMKWKFYRANGSTAMRLLLGNADAVGGDITSNDDIVYGTINKSADMSVLLCNYGAEGIKAIDYTYELNGQTGNVHYDLPTAIPPFYRAQRLIDIPMPALAEKGTYPIKFTLTGINGKKCAGSTCEATLKLYGRDTKHCAVLEEYTGTWCGYCPRGLVGLEVMTRLYPDRFIGLSYHNADPMCVVNDASQYPSAISGYPAAFLDRIYETDAYYGNETNRFGIDEVWLAVTKTYSPISVSVEAAFNDDAKTIAAKSTVASVDPERTVGCKVEYVLLADSLHGEGKSWLQSNYYAERPGVERDFPEPEFAKFYETESVPNVYFPDVVSYSTFFTNEQQPLPETLVEDQEYETSFTFNTDKVLNYVKEPIIQDKHNLRVVALVIAADGSILNAAQCKVDAAAVDAGISSAKLNAQTEDGCESIYTIGGTRINTLAPGLNIVKMRNGKTVKIVK